MLRVSVETNARQVRFNKIKIFHNPPKGDGMEVVPSVKNLRFGGLCPDQVGLWRFRSLRWFRAIVSLVRVRCWFWSFRDRGGFVASRRWLVLSVGFARVSPAAVSRPKCPRP